MAQIAYVPVNILLMKLIQVTFFFVCFVHWSVVIFPQGNREPHLLFDLLLFVYPTILSLTIFHEYVAFLILAYLLLASALIASSQTQTNKSNNLFDQIDSTRVPILSIFKGANMLLTCISILAIDFQVILCQLRFVFLFLFLPFF